MSPPINTISRLYYKQPDNVMCSQTLDEVIANRGIEYLPRTLDSREIWRCVTREDMDLAVGFTDVIPVGMYSKRAETPAVVQNRSDVERAVFSDQRTTAPIESAETEAAKRFLSFFEMTRIKFAGCAQTWRSHQNETASSNCFTNHFANDVENRRAFEFNRRHQRVHCPKNDSIFFSVGNLDLTTKTVEKCDLVHVYKFQPETAMPVRSQIYDVIDQSRLFDVTTLPESVSEFEIGVLNVDSSLERSLAAKKRNEMREKRHMFLENSELYQSERSRLDDTIPLPPYANKSQLYALGQWRLRQIDKRIWQPHPNPRPLSIMHPSMFFVFLSLSLSLSLSLLSSPSPSSQAESVQFRERRTHSIHATMLRQS